MVIRGDDAWVTANRNVPADLAKYGGVNDGTLVQSAMQEYNLKTGKLLYTLERVGPHHAVGLLHAAAAERLPVGRLPRQLGQPQ